MNEEIVESPLEAKIAEYDTFEKIVEQFTLVGYHDDIGHKLENNVAFIALQRYAGHWDSFVRRLEVAEDIAQEILVRMGDAPFDAIIFCPVCKMQHIDAPEPDICKCGHSMIQHSSQMQCNVKGDDPTTTANYRGALLCKCLNFTVGWTNPPHKSHLCKIEEGGCGAVFRPSDFPTNGVAEITTRGEKDSWPEAKQ